MGDVVDQENSEKSLDAYDQFVDAEVCLPDQRGRKMISRVNKRVNALFADHSFYAVLFPHG